MLKRRHSENSLKGPNGRHVAGDATPQCTSEVCTRNYPTDSTHHRNQPRANRTTGLSGFGQTLPAPAQSTPRPSVATMRKSHRRTRSVDAAPAKSALNVCLRVRPLLGTERPTDPPMQYNTSSVIAPSVRHNSPTHHTAPCCTDPHLCTHTHRALG